MSTQANTPWMTGWTVDAPLRIDFARVDRDWGTWEPGAVSWLEYRNLELDQASGGKLGCQHVRRAGEPAGDDEAWQANDLDFQLLYVLRGSATLATEDGETRLDAESAAVIPALVRHALTDLSDDFEAVEIAAPADYDVAWGRTAPLPERAATLDPARKVVVTHDDADQYVTGAGPRSFFEYRNLGARGPSDGRVHVHVVHALGQPHEAGTGWHYHTMAQWFMVLGGAADIRVEDQPRKHLDPIDCMCIGSGENMRHVVDRVSADYKVLEMCIPSEYETIPVDTPDKADG
jgi:quercetin dioxygenase-like cupin family protein